MRSTMRQLFALLTLLPMCAAMRGFRPRIPATTTATLHPSTNNCSLQWTEQRLDHFSSTTSDTYNQRYYTYTNYHQKGGPIFFYTGNEADVGLYVNATGLIWENAEAFSAFIVFAEHRYYGASQPNSTATGSPKYPYLSHEQALADYAVLIQRLKTWHPELASSPVIAFGGSYGGKLAAWMRMKYPGTVQGAISGSAPLLAFQGEVPAWRSNSYYEVITKAAAHYSPQCPANVRQAIAGLEAAGATEEGRGMLATAFGLCKPPQGPYESSMLKYFIRDAFDELAMGNYPWPSNYIAGTQEKPMPAWPLQVACSHLEAEPSETNEESLYRSMGQAVAVLYNVTGQKPCNELPAYPSPVTPSAAMDGIWDYQWCTETMPDSFWFTTTGETDMFWPNPFNQTLVDTHCQMAWGLTADRKWIAAEYAGRQLTLGHTNIFFSSGSFDGWSSAGVASNYSTVPGGNPAITSVLIEGGGHHLDLMFSHPDDPESVRATRRLELAHIRRWIEAYPAGARPARAWGDLL